MPSKENVPITGRPLLFGEVLFDRFPDGSAVLGGAPFNVAWHLHGFGAMPVFISRVGDDRLGQQVLGEMADWGMDTSGVQLDQRHPTGTVEVTLNSGQPEFDIRADCAYDFIAPVSLKKLSAHQDFALLYHGSLALRSTESRQALHQLRTHSQLPAFVDINLRPPWWERNEITWAMRDARWAKLNSDELAILNGGSDAGAEEDTATAIQARYGIDTLIVTMGEQGALILRNGHLHQGAPVPATTLVDTVGAGDAFSATVIYGLLCGWGMEILLHRAMEFASAICGIRGATLSDREFYRRFLQSWER